MKEEYVNYLKENLAADDLEEGLKLLEKGISPQYIVGNVNFYGNIIKVDKRVLIPRFETELLVEKTIRLVRDIFGARLVRILDIGTGSGAISIALKKELSCEVTGVDISKEALEVARDNALANKVDISFINSDVLDKVEGTFEVIISNPPYLREDDEAVEEIVRMNEPNIALFAKNKGLYFYEKILSEVRKNLAEEYLIAFEIGCEQAMEVEQMAYRYLGDVMVLVEKDYAQRDRFVFIFKK